MPGEHKDIYTSTTLAIVVISTFVLGGLTEPILSKMGMRVSIKATEERVNKEEIIKVQTMSLNEQFASVINKVDTNYLYPLFGKPVVT